MNDNRVWPVGYCAGGGESPYHTDGHATAEEACECYRQYTLDADLRFKEDSVDASTQRKCKECGTFTSGHASIGQYEIWPLCKEHRTREVVSKYFQVGESWKYLAILDARSSDP